jgi:lysophospholipase L1-like esterase
MNLLSLLRSPRHLLGSATTGSLVIVAACSGSASSPGTHAAVTPGDDSGVSTEPSSGLDAAADTATGTEDSGTTPTIGADSGTSSTSVDAAACAAKGNEVVLIGDSYFALSEPTSPPAGEITERLQSLATAAGALAQGDTYRHYYQSGANMATTYTTSTVTPIPTQFASAVSANPDLKYVIMDGGGNDILLENTACITASATSGISATCKAAVQGALDAATALFQSMKTAGVQKVIYFFYPHLPTTRFPSVNIMLDYAYPLVQAVCQASPVPCEFIDTRSAFNGNDASFIGPDDIHPTNAGSDAIAGLIWSTMQQECVALSP